MAIRKVLHDGNRLDHGHIAVDKRWDEAGRIDRQKFRIIFGASEKIDWPQLIRQA
jgi:hypothetical protein